MRRLEIEALELELCKAYDGTLRGFVEPVIILGAFRIYQQTAALVARCLLRPDLKSRPLPAAFPVSGQLKYRAAFKPEDAFVILGIALEEDAGTDIANVFSILERTQDLHFWKRGDAVPTPKSLAEFGTLTPTDLGAIPIELLLGTDPIESTTKADDYIGASAFFVLAAQKHEDLRMHFVDAERVNDWALKLNVKLT